MNFSIVSRRCFTRVAVTARRPVDAEVDAEAGAQSLHAAVDPVPGEDRVQAVVEPPGDGADVVVEPRLAIRRHRGEGGGDADGVAVVGAAVLTVTDRHQPVHHVAPAAEDAQRKAPADRLAQRTQVRRHVSGRTAGRGAGRRHGGRTVSAAVTARALALRWRGDFEAELLLVGEADESRFHVARSCHRAYNRRNARTPRSEER